MNEARTRELVRRRASAPFDASWVSHDLVPCESCGMFSDAIEMHHRKYRSRGGLWTPSNVVALCPDCHRKVTVQPRWSADVGLAVSQFARAIDVPVEVWYSRNRVLLDDAGGYYVDQHPSTVVP